MVVDSKVDFFVSYNSADKAWAEWTAWVLEQSGYSTIIQQWDFRPGGNFVVDMQGALKHAQRVIAVLSDDYLSADFTQSEWASAFATDPLGLRRVLIPVMVRPCKPTGLLNAIVHITVHGVNEEIARARLLDGVLPDRVKPVSKPPFPG